MSESVQRTLRLKKWIVANIEDLSGGKKGDFSEWVNRLLRQQLEAMGRTEGQYEARIYDLDRAGTQEPGAASGQDTI
jgi:hypothetical protein